MKILYKQTESIRSILARVIGETQVDNYFSYCGISKDGLMFSLYKDGKFYLRVSKRTVDEIKAVGGTPMMDNKIINMAKYFYLIPNHIVERLDEYPKWIFEGINAAKANKDLFKVDREKYIRYLINMNFAIERLLKRIGVCTVPQFMEKGAFSMCVDLFKYGVDVSDVLLLKLYGACHRRYFQTFSREEMLSIIAQANEVLQAEGLRQRFTLTYQ